MLYTVMKTNPATINLFETSSRGVKQTEKSSGWSQVARMISIYTRNGDGRLPIFWGSKNRISEEV